MRGQRCYLLVEKPEERVQQKSPIFAGCFRVLVWAICWPLSAAAVNLDALFWEKQSEAADLPYAVIASFVDHTDSSFLVKSNQTGELVFITPSNDVLIDGNIYQFDRFETNGLFLIGAEAQSVRIAMRFDGDVTNTNTAQPRRTDTGQTAPKQTTLDHTGKSFRPTTGFYQGTTPIEAVRDLAERLGVPRPITAALRSAPTTGRSRSGRPGWVMDNTLPPAFFALSPFEQGDIILTVDGVSAHDVDGLMNYIEQQNRSKRYNVELQRKGRLKMIEVYVK